MYWIPAGTYGSPESFTPMGLQYGTRFCRLIRAVPTIIWVLIFISGFGLTATTAIVGMSFHSVAYFIKSYSEAFEEVDPGAMEAMKASGGSWCRSYGVLSSRYPLQSFILDCHAQ